jgi:hypothetical protein
MNILSRLREWTGTIIDMWDLGLYVVFKKRGDREEGILSLPPTILQTVTNKYIKTFIVTEREKATQFSRENIK